MDYINMRYHMIPKICYCGKRFETHPLANACAPDADLCYECKEVNRTIQAIEVAEARDPIDWLREKFPTLGNYC